MLDRARYFSRIAARADVAALSKAFVLMAGVGSVGSVLARELARSGVGHLLLADGDHLEAHNLFRHELPECYLGANKAEAMAAHLSLNVPGLDVGGAPRHLDDTLSDREIDRFLAPADLLVVTTDSRRAQRRLATRALAMDLPAVIPGLYPDGGGEIFIQLDPGQACFRCWDDFRPAGAEVRGAASINADALDVIQRALYLCLAILEPGSTHRRDFAPPPGDSRPRQLFVSRPGAALRRATVERRHPCAGCSVGPSPLSANRRHGIRADRAIRRLSGGRPRTQAVGWPLVLSGQRRPPRIESVYVDSEIVVEGGPITLSWVTSGATSVHVETIGVQPARGSAQVLVDRTRTFRVQASNPFGRTIAETPVVRATRLPRLHEIPVPAPGGFTVSPLEAPLRRLRPSAARSFELIARSTVALPRPAAPNLRSPSFSCAWPPRLPLGLRRVPLSTTSFDDATAGMNENPGGRRRR